MMNAANRSRALVGRRQAFLLKKKSQHQEQRLFFSGKQGEGDNFSFFRRAWASYTEALILRPLVVKASTASLIFFTSDGVTQYLTDPSAQWDGTRSLSGATFGVVATGWLHYWWGFLEILVGTRVPVAKYRLQNTLIKVFVDQSIGAPLYIYTYYVITNFLQEWKLKSEAPSELLYSTHQKAAAMLLPTMMRHWTLWPAVHTVNFYFNPLHHRVLVQNLVLVGWSGYLSHLNNGGLVTPKLMTPKEEIEITVEIKRRETLRQQGR